MESWRGSLAVLTLAAVLIVPSAGEATTIGYFGSASAAVRDRDNVRFEVFETFANAAPDQIETVAGTQITANSAIFHGAVGPGLIATWAGATTTGTNVPASTSISGAQIFGFFEDTVTITAPGMAGQQGTVDFSLGISGNSAIGGNASSVAQYLLNARLGSTSITEFGGIQRGALGTEVFGVPAGMVSISADVTFGSPSTLYVEFGSAVGATSFVPEQWSSGAFAMYWDTLLWNGIEAVRDTDGNLLDGASLASVGGFDWMSAVERPDGLDMPPIPAQFLAEYPDILNGDAPVPVPLPATGWLLLAGVGAMWATRCRRTPA